MFISFYTISIHIQTCCFLWDDQTINNRALTTQVIHSSSLCSVGISGSTCGKHDVKMHGGKLEGSEQRNHWEDIRGCPIVLHRQVLVCVYIYVRTYVRTYIIYTYNHHTYSTMGVYVSQCRIHESNEFRRNCFGMVE